MTYAELLCQSNFSFLEGASHPEELIAEADALGYRALALTDECSVAGVVRAYAEHRRRELDIKLIVGSRLKMPGLDLVLLCPSRPAYAELCRIITNARRRSPKGQYQLEAWDLKSVQHCLVLWLPRRRARPDLGPLAEKTSFRPTLAGTAASAHPSGASLSGALRAFEPGV